MVFAYSKMGWVVGLNLEMFGSFRLPYLVKASALFWFSDDDLYVV